MSDYYVGDFPLILRRHARAKHLKLRFEARSSSAILTLPPGISDRKAIAFAEKNHDWICEQYDKSPDCIPLEPDEYIPFRGKSTLITHAPDEKASVRITQDRIMVGGPLAGFEVRLQNWLKKQAREALHQAVAHYIPNLNTRPHRIVVGDTKSRWGSCSSRKTLSFSWRLILAPPDVLHYVVAHEMAHLKEMNHSPKFWAVVEGLCPDWKKHRRWLKSEGNELMFIG